MLTLRLRIADGWLVSKSFAEIDPHADVEGGKPGDGDNNKEYVSHVNMSIGQEFGAGNACVIIVQVFWLWPAGEKR